MLAGTGTPGVLLINNRVDSVALAASAKARFSRHAETLWWAVRGLTLAPGGSAGDALTGEDDRSG